MSLIYDGEKIVEKDDRDDERPTPPPSGKAHGERLYGRAQDDADERRMGLDERCGGGRRVIRKRIE